MPVPMTDEEYKFLKYKCLVCANYHSSKECKGACVQCDDCIVRLPPVAVALCVSNPEPHYIYRNFKFRIEDLED